VVVDTTAIFPSVTRDDVTLGWARKGSGLNDNPGIGRFTHFAAIQGYLSDDELVSLANNPGQLWAPEEQIIWVPGSVESASLITTTPAALTLAKNDATILQSAPSLITTTPGALTLAKNTAIVIQATSSLITTTPAALTLAKNTATVLQTIASLITTTPAALALAKNTATVIQTNPGRIDAIPAILAITAPQATVLGEEHVFRMPWTGADAFPKRKKPSKKPRKKDTTPGTEPEPVKPAPPAKRPAPATVPALVAQLKLVSGIRTLGDGGGTGQSEPSPAPAQKRNAHPGLHAALTNQSSLAAAPPEPGVRGSSLIDPKVLRERIKTGTKESPRTPAIKKVTSAGSRGRGLIDPKVLRERIKTGTKESPQAPAIKKATSAQELISQFDLIKRLRK
jgi:hypothetical protein